ncbi:uncharacterized protein FTOL_01172 [Fusarium torulosum]|uniref:Uncharacterized protein n=1 Tax=Fusarium torulosum TaxID=33205 RepID=A0AAE8SDM0_9HYPO|nr:uncharacterized protein FTOL_01172 [Fusarium torulosum]
MSNWLNNPMLVNDSQLADILSIEHSTKASPKLDAGSVTYFRSWPMVADQLCQVVEELRKHGYGNRVEAWTLVLKGCLPATPITVRYVGSTSAPRNPFKRVQKNTERPQSLLGTFLSTIDRLFPRVAKSHQVYAINGSFIADLSMESAKQNVLFQRFYNSATDHAERCMVTFFGTRTLLNRQRGGKHRMLTPGYEEERVLMRCNTTLLSKANSCFTPPPEKVISDVSFLLKSWWEYARKEIWLDEDRAKEIDRKTYISGTYSQAVAKSSAHGSSLLALCGHEPPISSINDGADILSGVRATSSFVRSVLTSMAAVETGICSTPITALTDLISFNQLLNWPRLSFNQKEKSRKLFDSWLVALRPVIIVSFGQHVDAWLCQPTRRQTPPKSLLKEVGVARTVQIPNGGTKAIVIPHLHPGSYVRNPTTSSQDKIFWYPWVATWVYMDTAMNLLSRCETLYTSRDVFCIELATQAEAILEEAGYFESLDAAKTGFVAKMKIDNSAITLGKSLSSGGTGRAREHVLHKFTPSEDRIIVLDQYLSYRAPSLEHGLQIDSTLAGEGSKKRTRDVFEQSHCYDHDPRADLTSNNWGPSDNTLNRWRQVHRFIEGNECLVSVHRLYNKTEQHRRFFGVAASVHRYHGGLLVGKTPIRMAFPSHWNDDVTSFKDEFSKCIQSFQNAVINSYIHGLPDFLLERQWTASISLLQPPEAATVLKDTADMQSLDQAPVASSLFETSSTHVHPPYHYKLALERCGQTRGTPNSLAGQQQAESLFSSNIAVEGLWIAASMESLKDPQTVQPERQMFIETFGGNIGATHCLSSDQTLDNQLQKSSQEFMTLQALWLTSMTRGKVGRSPCLDLNQIDGHKIDFSQRGVFRLTYRLEDESKITLDIKLGPSIAPLESEDIRTMHFTASGIDIRTPTGYTLIVPAYNSACTLPKSVMRKHKDGSDFLALWRMIRKRTDSTSFARDSWDIDSNYPPELRVWPIGEKGANLPAKRPETIQQPERNDALWLLKEFIDLRFPSGGAFWTGGRVSFPLSTDDVTDFTNFLKLPDNCTHPYAQWWYEKLVLKQKGPRNWSIWLSCLRSTKVEHVNAPKSATTPGTYRKKCAVITLGPLQVE